MPLGEPSPFAEQGEKVAGGRMRGWATLAHARNPSPQPSPLAPQRERESKTDDFVALLSFRCLLAKQLKWLGTKRTNGLRTQAGTHEVPRNRDALPPTPNPLVLPGNRTAHFISRRICRASLMPSSRSAAFLYSSEENFAEGIPAFCRWASSSASERVSRATGSLEKRS